MWGNQWEADAALYLEAACPEKFGRLVDNGQLVSVVRSATIIALDHYQSMVADGIAAEEASEIARKDLFDELAPIPRPQFLMKGNVRALLPKLKKAEVPGIVCLIKSKVQRPGCKVLRKKGDTNVPRE